MPASRQFSTQRQTHVTTANDQDSHVASLADLPVRAQWDRKWTGQQRTPNCKPTEGSACLVETQRCTASYLRVLPKVR
jgi:hypothetical protein